MESKKYFYGNLLSEREVKENRVSYATLSKCFEAVLCNNIAEVDESILDHIEIGKIRLLYLGSNSLWYLLGLCKHFTKSRQGGGLIPPPIKGEKKMTKAQSIILDLIKKAVKYNENTTEKIRPINQVGKGNIL